MRIPLLLLLFSLLTATAAAQSPAQVYHLAIDGTAYTIDDLQAELRPFSDAADSDWLLDIQMRGKQPEAFSARVLVTMTEPGQMGSIYCVCKGQQGYKDGKVYCTFKLQTDLNGSQGYAQYGTELNTKYCGGESRAPSQNLLQLEHIESTMVRNANGVEVERKLYHLNGSLQLYDLKKETWVLVMLELKNVTI